mgnify:CR=1 FL=1
MAYIAKVNIETAARRYKPGEKITGHLSDADVAFLKKHNFIANGIREQFFRVGFLADIYIRKFVIVHDNIHFRPVDRVGFGKFLRVKKHGIQIIK